MIDIVEVKAAIRRGRLSIQVKNNALLMKDMQTEEAVKLSDFSELCCYQVVHAKWVKTWDMIDGHDGYQCSACKRIKYFDHYKGLTVCTPYCDKCGARMDGEEVAID